MSELLLFNNCTKIKKMFSDCQPYIVYNAYNDNLFHDNILKNLVVNDDDNIHSDKVMHRFSGKKRENIDAMNVFLNDLKEFTINNNIDKTKKYIDTHLLPIIENTGELLEGNIFMLHCTTNYTDVFSNKIKNISNVVLNKNIKNIMEIGFNSGFSTLLMLMSNSTAHVSCFDLGKHLYTMPCYNKIKETFGDRINITIGDSTKTLQNVDEKYDLIHIDGGHSMEVAKTDIINSYKLSKKGTILIMDDYDYPPLHDLWDSYIVKYNLKKLQIKLCESPHHDIKYV